MILSKSKNMISSRIKRAGSEYTSGLKRFKGLLMKSNVSQDIPRAQFTLMLGFDAEYDDGKIITDGSENYVPLQVEKPSVTGAAAYQKLYLMRANASGDLAHHDYPATASFGQWDIATGSTGWLTKKTSVRVNFEKISLRVDTEAIGQIEAGDFILTMPWGVNASFTPVAECRFTDRQGRKWKIEDVDDKTYFLQAYQMRVSADDR